MADDEEELEDGLGTMYTHYDCPHCGEADEVEGDADGDVKTCRECELKFRVRRM